ncbi:MAG TPA: hypothetical protein VGA94_05680 [Thermodesulfobacteriota bacterium]
MAERPTEINDENVLTVDVNAIAKDRRFVDLKFENAKNKLAKVQEWLLEAKDLGYEQLLIKSDLDTLSSLVEQLKEHLQNLLTFDNRTTRENAQQEHDNLENRIDGYYNNVYQHLPMRVLPFLRQEAARKSQDQQSLAEQQKAAARAEAAYKKLAEQMQTQLEEWEQKKKEVEAAPGEVAATRFGRHFKSQAQEYGEELQYWYDLRARFFRWLVGIIVANLVLYLLLFVTEKLNLWPYLPPEEFFTIQYGVAKITLLSILSYGMHFASRNYSIRANLVATNKHRKNVADTLNEFLATKPEASDRSHIIKKGTEEMFQHISTGYIATRDSRGDKSVVEVVDGILRPNKES